MEAKNLREKDLAGLQEELLKLRREQFNKVRKNIAKVKTVLTEKKRVGSEV